MGTEALQAGNFYEAGAGGARPDLQGVPASFRNGGDNINSSFIAGVGPPPRGEFVQPMSVIKAQDSGNLATTLRDTANALRDTRKTDGTFEKWYKS